MFEACPFPLHGIVTNGRDDHERVVTHSDLSLITGEVGSVSRVQLTVCVCVCGGGGGGGMRACRKPPMQLSAFTQMYTSICV